MAQVIKQFLLKMSNEDPDFRYMAASDLLNEFKAKPEMQIDPDWQKKVKSFPFVAKSNGSGLHSGFASIFQTSKLVVC